MAEEHATPEGQQPQDQQPATGSDDLGDPGKKAIAEERKARKAAEKSLSDMQAKLKEFEDRDKTELQKLSERAELAEKESADRANELMRLQIAAEKGLTAAQARRLVGATREEMEADAEELAGMFTPEKPKRRVPDLKQGARGTLPQPDENDLFRQWMGGRR